MDKHRLACDRCSASFVRAANLQRHRHTHNSGEAFHCSYCLSKFSRRDSLRKHWRSCPLRKASGLHIPNPELRGRKRRACDQCATSKRACDLELPCSTCLLKGCSCSYHRMSSPAGGTELGADYTDWNEEIMSLGFLDSLLPEPRGPAMAPRDATPILQPAIPISLVAGDSVKDYGADPQGSSVVTGWHVLRRESFEFLLNFEMGGGINRVFNFMTSLEQNYQILNFESLLPSTNSLYDGLLTDRDFWKSREFSSSTKTVEWLFDPLLPQAKAIWEKLLKKPQTRENGILFDDHDLNFNDRCIEFFNPQNLRRLLDLYWKRWHTHCPIIHEPSFDLSQVPTDMVMVLSLLGAFVSFDNQEAVKARQWLDATESLLFSTPWLSRHDFARQMEPPLTRETKLRLMQTALLICVLQTWEGTESSRSRIRELRYPHLVQASREVDCLYPDIEHEMSLHSWKEFILDEQVIRTKSFIFLLDSAFSIFHNMPPHITVSDLAFPFPYPDTCFRVHNGEAFWKAVQQHSPDYPKIRRTHICDTVKILCDTEALNTLSCPPEMPALNGFILISAIHSIIVCQEMSCFLSPTTVASLRRALDRWLRMWKSGCPFNSHSSSEIYSSLDQPSVSTGFTRHSYEYYCLALAKLEIMGKSLEQRHILLANGLRKGNVKDLIWNLKRMSSAYVDYSATGDSHPQTTAD